MSDETVASAWQEHPGTLEFGSSYLCADGDGVLFSRLLVAGSARDTAYWSQVAWALPTSAIPKPPITLPTNEGSTS